MNLKRILYMLGLRKPKLKDFYKDYQKWVDRGAPDELPFDRDQGLCGNLSRWCQREGGSNASALDREMVGQFEMAGLSWTLPFNTSPGSKSFREEGRAKIMHLNPERLAWVWKHAVES